MTLVRFLYYSGASLFILLGAVHLGFVYFTPALTAEQEQIMHAMREFSMNLPGRNGNLLEYYNGFSITMGFLLIAYGGQVFATCKVKLSNGLLLFHATVGLVLSIISYFLFFAVPLVMSCLAFICFLLVFLFNNRSA